VANENAFVLDQDLFNNQADDPLPLLNVESVGGATQLGEERLAGARGHRQPRQGESGC
jgi:hypothetical protein